MFLVCSRRFSKHLLTSACVYGTVGQPDGLWGGLRSDALNLRGGVYMPNLPAPILRIYPWVGESNLCEIGS